MSENEKSVRRSKVSDEDIIAASLTARNMRHLLEMLGLAAYGGNYETMRRRLQLIGVVDPRFQPRPTEKGAQEFSHQELRLAAKRSDSFAQMLRVLNVDWSASAHRRIKAATVLFGIDTTHFLGHAHNRGQKFPDRGTPLEEILVAGKLTSTIKLKQRLLETGLLARECAICERDDWNGEPIPLELDHISGDRTDNRLENLRLVCPNCHAQTPTYRGRNIGRQPGDVPTETTPPPDLAGDADRRLRTILPAPRVA